MRLHPGSSSSNSPSSVVSSSIAPARIGAVTLAATALLFAATPAPAVTLAPAKVATAGFAPASGALLFATTVGGAPAAGRVDLSRDGALLASGRANAPIALPSGVAVTARVRLDGYACSERTIPAMAAGARSTRTVPVAYTAGRLRVRIFHGATPSAVGVAEVFRGGESVSCANSGEGGVIDLATGTYRVSVRRFATVQWFDVTVRDGALSAVTAVF